MSGNPFTNSTSRDFAKFDLFGSLRSRILVSLATVVGWLSTVLIFVAFFAARFSLFQDIVVIVVSLIILGGVLLGAWLSFGMRFVDHWDD